MVAAPRRCLDQALHRVLGLVPLWRRPVVAAPRRRLDQALRRVLGLVPLWRPKPQSFAEIDQPVLGPRSSVRFSSWHVQLPRAQLPI